MRAHGMCSCDDGLSPLLCQARLPGREWKERHGTAGVPSDERRGSPIVELSLLLARAPCSL